MGSSAQRAMPTSISGSLRTSWGTTTSTSCPTLYQPPETVIDLAMGTTHADMLRVVLEGVAFAIRDSFEVVRNLGINIPSSNICYGGSKSPLWKR